MGLQYIYIYTLGEEARRVRMVPGSYGEPSVAAGRPSPLYRHQPWLVPAPGVPSSGAGCSSSDALAGETFRDPLKDWREQGWFHLH